MIITEYADKDGFLSALILLKTATIGFKIA